MSLRPETVEDSNDMEAEFDRMAAIPELFVEEVDAIASVLEAEAEPIAMFDVGCWSGLLACRLFERTNHIARYVGLDAGSTLCQIADRRIRETVKRVGSNVDVVTHNWKIQPDATQDLDLVATATKTLIGASVSMRPLREEDAFVMRSGPPITPSKLIEAFSKSVDGCYVKIDINGFEHLVVRAILEHGLIPKALHVKLTYAHFHMTLNMMKRAADALGFMEPPSILEHMTAVNGTLAISRDRTWCEVQVRKEVGRPHLFMQSNWSDGHSEIMIPKNR